MQSAVFFDALLTFALSAALVAACGTTLVLLPWSDADRAATTRAFGALARRVGEGALAPARARTALARG